MGVDVMRGLNMGVGEREGDLRTWGIPGLQCETWGAVGGWRDSCHQGE